MVLKTQPARILVLLLVFILVSFTFVAANPGLAQPAGDACTALAERALAEVDQNCTGLDRNSVCYGFNRVGATFFQEVADTVFAAPADRIGIDTVETVQTAALDETLGTWGIAVMKVQANIPNTLPGQNVVFILMGDTQLENAVPADQAAQPSTVTVSVQTIENARVRSQPSLRANVLKVAESGQTLEADAVDATGEWLRVVYDGTPGWINRVVVTAADFSALPVVTDETRSPMQAFYLTTGLGDTTCNEAPSMLVVQGPKGVKIDLTVNEAKIQIGSTIILRLLDENTMEIIVMDGEALVNNLIVPEGFRATVPVTLPGTGDPASTPEPEATAEPSDTQFPIVSGDWEGCQPLTPEQRQALQPLVNLPPSILNYVITVPGDTNAYCLPPGELPLTNNQPDNQNPGQGDTIVDCTRFQPTSPLGGANFGAQTFYWDPAPGATGYRVNIFKGDGSYVRSFESNGSITSLAGDTGDARGFFSFGWNVEALLNGQVVCTSRLVTIPLAAPPADPTTAPPQPEATPAVTANPPER